MKLTLLRGGILVFALALAGCQSSIPEDSMAGSMSASESKSVFVPIQRAMNAAGLTVKNEAVDPTVYSADLINDNGSAQLKVIRTASAESARKTYNENLSRLENDGYTLAATRPQTGAELTELLNEYLGVYALVAVDDTGKEVVVIDNVLEPNKEDCLKALGLLGIGAQK